MIYLETEIDMRKRHLVLLAFYAFLFQTGCIPDIGTVGNEEWNPSYAIPVLNDTIYLEDILSGEDSQEIFEFTTAQTLTIHYQERLSPILGAGLVEIPTLSIPVSMDQQEAPATFPPSFSLKMARLSKGTVRYELSNPHPEAVNVEITINNLEKQGAPFSLAVTIPAAAGPGSPHNQQGQMEIEDYVLDLSSGNFSTRYSANLSNSGTAVNLPPFLLELQDLEYTFIEGYFGQFSAPNLSGGISIDFLRSWTGGEIRLEDPRIMFTFYNEFGLPVRISTETFVAETHREGAVPLINDRINNGFVLNYPGQAGQTMITELALDRTNSNLVSLVPSIPYELQYAFNLVTNPEDNPNIINHLTDTAELSVEVDLELPLHGSSRGFSASSIFSLDLEGTLGRLERAGIKLIAENSFPIGAGLQGYFQDASGQVIDSLFSQPLMIEGAPVDDSGKVTGIRITEGTEMLDDERFSELKARARILEIQVALETTGGGNIPVKISKPNAIVFKLGFLAGL